jgi:aminoglycoside phosphotransferase (APT) family kinase protein
MLTANDAEATANAFDLGPNPVLAGPVARGEVGQIWKLTTATAEWAIKEAFEPPSPAEAEHDATFQELVAAAGVNVPEVRRACDGQVLAEVAGSLIRVYSWVELSASDAFIDPAMVGQLVASIHRVVYHGANGVHPWYTDPVGANRWDELIEALRREQAPFSKQLAEQRDDLVALEALLRTPTQLQACHRDLFADNVLSTPNTELCVIDWENSGLADPNQELAVVLFEYGRGSSDRARLLSQTYIDHGGPGRVRDPGDFSMLIAQLGHIGEVACQRWLDPSKHDERARNEGRINEFLTDRLTVDTIHEILSATQ